MKKFILGIIVGVFLSISSAAFADSVLKKVDTFLSRIHLQINNNGLITNQDIDSLVYRDRTYVPLAFISKNLGMTVSYFPNGNSSVMPPNQKTITIDNYVESKNELKDPEGIIGIQNILFTHGNQEAITFQIKQYENLPANKPFLLLSFYNKQNHQIYSQSLSTRLYNLKKDEAHTWYTPLDTTMDLSQYSMKVSFSDVAPATFYKNDLTPLTNKPTYLMNIEMSDSERGWAQGDGIVLRTNDGGHSWGNASPTELTLYGPNSGIKNQDYFFLNDNAWISRPPMTIIREHEVTVWHTSDGGKMWTRSTLPIIESWEQESFSHISFTDNTNGYVILTSTNDLKKTSLFSTSDGGEHWKREGEVSGLMDLPQGFKMYSDHSGWLYDREHFYKSKDGGLTWKAVNIPMPDSKADGYIVLNYKPFFFGAQENEGILILDLIGNKKNQLIYRSNDRGTNWSFAGRTPNADLNNFSETKDGVMISTLILNQKAELYVSKDMGLSWVKRGTLPNNSIPVFLNGQMGWTFDLYPGNVFTTTDGGLTWSPLRKVE